ncbi:MAG: hypothetical protein ABIJ61_04170, partial [bacterium]
ENAASLLAYSQNDPGAGLNEASAGPTNKLGRLIVREPQIMAFTPRLIDQYQRRMVAHLQQYFPDQCREMGETGVSEFVKHGISRAAVYGIKTELAVQQYLEIMMYFGRDFDVDHKRGLASRILNDPAIESGKARSDKLYETGLSQHAAETPTDRLDGVNG